MPNGFQALALSLALVLGLGTAAAEERHVIRLTAGERDFLLQEMRQLLASVQGIVAGAAAGDMERVARAARAAGTHPAEHVPESLLRKLPPEFKHLGMAMHRAFDQIALDAESFGDRDHALRQTAETLSRCVACHAAYAVQPEP